MQSNHLKILLAGGGSGGPVSPVLAVAQELKKLKPKTEFLFVGTHSGPESLMVEPTGIPFVFIPGAKWRRYLSIKNFLTPFVLILGFLKSLSIIRKFQPDVVFGAGSFVTVPVAWAAKCLGVPVVIHQQDATIGLANRLVAPIAAQITTAFEKTSKEFYSGSGLFEKKLASRASWVGNPVRPDILDSSADAAKFFSLHDDLPILLVLGGATGASQINDMLTEILSDLTQDNQVIHQTGRGKNKTNFRHTNYHPFELIPFPEYARILKLAHIVVARAGLSTIAELSALKKVAIIIPMPKTHQEDNAKILSDQHAAVVLTGVNATPKKLKEVINSLKFKPKDGEILSKNMRNLMPADAGLNIAKIIIGIKNQES